MHNGEDCRSLLQQRRVESEAARPGVKLPELHLPNVTLGAVDVNPIAAAEKEVTPKLLPWSGGGESDGYSEMFKNDSDGELLETKGQNDSDVGFMTEPGRSGAEGKKL